LLGQLTEFVRSGSATRKKIGVSLEDWNARTLKKNCARDRRADQKIFSEKITANQGTAPHLGGKFRGAKCAAGKCVARSGLFERIVRTRGILCANFAKFSGEIPRPGGFLHAGRALAR
jgi:hypothetical protein